MRAAEDDEEAEARERAWIGTQGGTGIEAEARAGVGDIDRERERELYMYDIIH